MTSSLTDVPKDKKLVLYCDTGMRAEMAYFILKDQGYDARFLDGTIKFQKDGNFKITTD